MQLNKSVPYWLALALIVLTNVIVVAQKEEVPQLSDLEDPVDTTDILVAKGGNSITITDEILRERLGSLSSCLELRATAVVKGYIKTYVQAQTEKSKNMLGKRLTYFPLYEAKMREYGVPDDLKFLSVVESALNPKAVSRVGATGLWQFMPSTGGEYGLKTNSAVEDRSNPVKSTDAAARHLRDLYKQFDDWALALAAYNSGAGRVNSAIRRAGSRNFWSIQRFLPAETRNYVPAFIAATYICNYFNLHGLTPNEPDLDLQLTDFVNVYEGISFRDIAEATGISYEVIKDLNPGFKRDYVPPTTDGHYVIVPQRVMPAFIRYLNSVSSARKYKLESIEKYTSADNGDGRYWISKAKPQEMEHVDQFAARLGLSGVQIRSWNDMESNFVQPGQMIKLYRPVYVQKHSGIRIEAPATSTPTVKPATGTKPGTSPTNKTKPGGSQSALVPQEQPSLQPKQYQYHTVRRNESLEDIARQYATSVESLRKLNNLDQVRFGARLKIREY
ncbi:MAG: transglycosylase SLT domain-containing protein [Saprospiraceae bacterium]|nr:transglycosylase SLT domain-containing protein [Saprospiraceae bacterium]